MKCRDINLDRFSQTFSLFSCHLTRVDKGKPPNNMKRLKFVGKLSSLSTLTEIHEFSRKDMILIWTGHSILSSMMEIDWVSL